MDAIAVGLPMAGLAVIAGGWIVYLWRIPRGLVPERATGTVLSQWLGIALAIFGIIWSLQSGTLSIIAGLLPSTLALMMGSFFLWLYAQRKLPLGDLQVAVGEPLLPFESLTSDGARFHTDDLAGKRTLFKFFRGGW